jgi:hypothetical protein
MTNIPEKVTRTEGYAPSGEPTPARRRRVAAHARDVAPSEGRSVEFSPPKFRRLLPLTPIPTKMLILRGIF